MNKITYHLKKNKIEDFERLILYERLYKSQHPKSKFRYDVMHERVFNRLDRYFKDLDIDITKCVYSQKNKTLTEKI